MTRFEAAYKNRPFLFGKESTEELMFVIDRFKIGGKALELGCGDGRDTFHVIKNGMTVLAIDKADSAINTLRNRKDLSEEEKKRLTAIAGDVTHLPFPPTSFDFIYSVTLFDHLHPNEGKALFQCTWNSLRPGGFYFAKVHTVDDAGYTKVSSEISEFSSEIQHYYNRNELLRYAQSYGNVKYYLETKELDLDHGAPHTHAFASVLILKEG